MTVCPNCYYGDCDDCDGDGCYCDCQLERLLGGEQNKMTNKEKQLADLLYQCVVELSYVQCVENCGSGLCATAKGNELVNRGMALLGVKDLSAETLDEAPKVSAVDHGEGQ